MPDNPTDVALGYVRDEVSALRTTVHNELGKVSRDVATLGAEVRAHIAEQAPRIAVLEHRVTETEKDIAAADARADTARVDSRRLRWQLGIALVACLLSALLAWLPTLIGG